MLASRKVGLSTHHLCLLIGDARRWQIMSARASSSKAMWNMTLSSRFLNSMVHVDVAQPSEPEAWAVEECSS